jgi:hypothetical protein
MKQVIRSRAAILFAVLMAYSSGICAHAQELIQDYSNLEAELVLDLWPSRDGVTPLQIAVRNLGFEIIPSSTSMQLLMQGTLNISNPDGSMQSISLGIWRGRAPDDIERGDLAYHCSNNSPIDTLFTMEENGRYLVWWTQGKMKSNVLVFQKNTEGIQKLP